MLYDEWKSLAHLSTDDNGKSSDIARRRKDLGLIFEKNIDTPDEEYKALFALQTTYAIIVKLIAWKVIGRLSYNRTANYYCDLTEITSSELQMFFQNVESGYSYKAEKIFNLLEGDFFSWYSDESIWSTDFWVLMKTVIKHIDQYSSFDFNIAYQPIDIFKDLYMSIVPKSVRHSMGEYFTPEWLADYVVTESLKDVSNPNWKAIDPCCGSGIFIISLIRKIVGNINLRELTETEKKELRQTILSRVYGIDINPLSVLTARVGYYLALLPLGHPTDIEIPIYLGDSAITPVKTFIDGIECYKYSVLTQKSPFDVMLPKRFVKTDNFGEIMSELQSYVNATDETSLFIALESKFTEQEKSSLALMSSIKELVHNLVVLRRKNWDGIWVRIATNFMLIARLESFDVIVGNPPWVKWEHLPTIYAAKIKELCDIRHIFTNRGRFGGTQLNICALIANVAASNWLAKNGILAFLMPDSIMSQNSYEEFRYFYTNYDKNERLYLQRIDKWEKPLRPFRCDNKPVTQDFNTYYFAAKPVDYRAGIPVRTISRVKSVTDAEINKCITFSQAQKSLVFTSKRAAQLSEKSSAFSYVSSKYDFSKIIGPTSYLYRTGVEFTPQELYMLVDAGEGDKPNHYRFRSKEFQAAKYKIYDTPLRGWHLPTELIYPIVRGPMISPFKYQLSEEYCILPYSKEDTTQPIGVHEMITDHEELFNYLVNHKELIDQQSGKSKEMHRGDDFYALSKIGPYTFADHIVAARDNSKFCATVVNKKTTPWGEKKQTICVKHTIIISQDKTGRFIDADEANYICGILNSDIVVEYIHSTFKTNGFSLNKSHLYLPLYDSTNALHREISDLALRAATGEEDVQLVKEKVTELYIQICQGRLSAK